MHKGSCLCGAIEYEIAGTLGSIVYCHCSRCRKASGSAFNAIVPVLATNFRILKGQEFLKDYRNDAGVSRVFCGTCGSPIVGKRDSAPETVRVCIGTIDTPLNSKVSAHIFVGSKAEWDEIHDAVPQYAERP